MLNLILMGPPGAGKGTQAQKLIAEFHLPQISTGDILREARAAGTELGKQAAAIMDAGKLVPDAVVVGLVEERLARPDVAVGFILDGFPRTVAEATALAEILERRHLEVSKVVVIDVADRKKLVARVTGRWSCPKCKTVYHLVNKPPQVAGRCDHDDTLLTQRSDDTAEKLIRRLEEYDSFAPAVIAFYKGQDLVSELDGEGVPDAVYGALMRAIGR